MSDLFEVPAAQSRKPSPPEPLAARMRPRTLDEVAGQQHILAPGKLLRRAIESDRFTSLIFYGPPGTGKTTLASVIARTTGSRFESLNGVESNVAEIRAKIDQARTWRELRGETTILFIDEIHRFNKAQQDVLLPHIERGIVRFIGATTHNPYFHVNSPLVSRSQIFQLEPTPFSPPSGPIQWLFQGPPAQSKLLQRKSEKTNDEKSANSLPNKGLRNSTPTYDHVPYYDRDKPRIGA